MRQSVRLMATAFASMVVTAVVLLPAPSSANAEDVCPSLVGGWGPCNYPLPTNVACQTDPASQACALAKTLSTSFLGGTRIALQIAAPAGSRSTFHMDATYYLAQAAGFTPRQAYLIAAYDETVDMTQYVHRDQAGKLLPDPKNCTTSKPDAACALQTAALPGVDRDNFEGGGVFMHFMAPFAAPGGPVPSTKAVISQASADTGTPPVDVPGMAPVATDPQNEPVLTNVRRWALGQGKLCVAGLTQRSARGDYATGANCFRSTTRVTSTINGRMPFSYQLGAEADINWTARLGEMQLSGRPGEAQVPASRIASLVGAKQAPLARFGTYMHVLQDRISHHICNTASYVTGPRPAGSSKIAINPIANDIYQGLIAANPGAISRQKLVTDPDFIAFFDRKECDQVTHSSRHDPETGHQQDTIAAEDRTTAPSLLMTFNELRHLATSGMGQSLRPAPRMSMQVDSAALRKRLVDALDEPTADKRLAAFSDAALASCLLPLPGYGGYGYSSWTALADQRPTPTNCPVAGPDAS